MRFRAAFGLLLSFLLTACQAELLVIKTPMNGISMAFETLPSATVPATETLLPLATFTPTVSSQPTNTAIPQPIVHRVESGEGHSCILINDGTVECWGKNEYGQLGDGSIENRDEPVQVENLENAQNVDAGWGHTCALIDEGAVLCWGYNANGELGDGTRIDKSQPVYVNGLSGVVTSIAVGDDHTCAVMETGEVQCWGFNRSGQLGDGTTDSRTVAVRVDELSGVQALAAGWEHTCALTEDGLVYCWGSNEYGQLGHDSAGKNVPLPVEVKGLESAASALTANGGHTCALLETGKAQCWGSNQYGQLGDGSIIDRAVPVSVLKLEGVRALAAGGRHTCAIVGNGEMLCWGWNYYGQLGVEDRSMQAEPVSVVGLPGLVKEMGLGWRHTCVVLESGKIACWGANESNQIWNDWQASHETDSGPSEMVSSVDNPQLAPTCPPETASNVVLQGNYVGLVYSGRMEGFSWMEYIPIGTFQDRSYIATVGRKQEHYAILLEVLVCQDENGDSYWEVLDEILLPSLKENELISLSCDTDSKYEGLHAVGIVASHQSRDGHFNTTERAWIVSPTIGIFEEVPVEDIQYHYEVSCQFDWSRRTKD